MVIEVRPLQFLNAKLPIVVTLFGMVMEDSPVQPFNAHSPMDVMLLGIVMEDRLLQPKKAYLPKDVALGGIEVFLQPATNVFVTFSIMALQLSRESYTVFSSSTMMVLIFGHSANTP